MPCDDDSEDCIENKMESKWTSSSSSSSSSSSFSLSPELAFPAAPHPCIDSKPASAPQKAAARARQLLSFTQQLILQREQKQAEDRLRHKQPAAIPVQDSLELLRLPPSPSASSSSLSLFSDGQKRSLKSAGKCRGRHRRDDKSGQPSLHSLFELACDQRSVSGPESLLLLQQQNEVEVEVEVEEESGLQVLLAQAEAANEDRDQEVQERHKGDSDGDGDSNDKENTATLQPTGVAAQEKSPLANSSLSSSLNTSATETDSLSRWGRTDGSANGDGRISHMQIVHRLERHRQALRTRLQRLLRQQAPLLGRDMIE